MGVPDLIPLGKQRFRRLTRRLLPAAADIERPKPERHSQSEAALSGMVLLRTSRSTDETGCMPREEMRVRASGDDAQTQGDAGLPRTCAVLGHVPEDATQACRIGDGDRALLHIQ